MKTLYLFRITIAFFILIASSLSAGNTQTKSERKIEPYIYYAALSKPKADQTCKDNIVGVRILGHPEILQDRTVQDEDRDISTIFTTHRKAKEYVQQFLNDGFEIKYKEIFHSSLNLRDTPQEALEHAMACHRKDMINC